MCSVPDQPTCVVKWSVEICTSHVGCAAVMAMGIACAGSSLPEILVRGTPSCQVCSLGAPRRLHHCRPPLQATAPGTTARVSVYCDCPILLEAGMWTWWQTWIQCRQWTDGCMWPIFGRFIVLDVGRVTVLGHHGFMSLHPCLIWFHAGPFLGANGNISQHVLASCQALNPGHVVGLVRAHFCLSTPSNRAPECEEQASCRWALCRYSVLVPIGSWWPVTCQLLARPVLPYPEPKRQSWYEGPARSAGSQVAVTGQETNSEFEGSVWSSLLARAAHRIVAGTLAVAWNPVPYWCILMGGCRNSWFPCLAAVVLHGRWYTTSSPGGFRWFVERLVGISILMQVSVGAVILHKPFCWSFAPEVRRSKAAGPLLAVGLMWPAGFSPCC